MPGPFSKPQAALIHFSAACGFKRDFFNGEFIRAMTQPFIIAHRGNVNPRQSLGPPENTIAAFEQAIGLGTDLIEFDVRTTQDQVRIVYHDSKVSGVQIGTSPWSTLQTLNPQIPTLAATLQHCQNRIRFDVEIKELGDELGIVELLLSQLSPDDFVITSFNLKSLQIIKQHYPEVPIGLLLNPSWRDRQPHSAHVLQAQIAELQPNFLAPRYKLIDNPWLQAINPNQLPYWVWTVNARPQIQRFLHHPQVTGIITDNCPVAIGLT